MAKKAPPTPEELQKLKDAMDSTELDFANAKLAYYHRTEYKGQLVAYENLEQYAKIFIAANYAYQKALYGKVRVNLAVARLMRE